MSFPTGWVLRLNHSGHVRGLLDHLAGVKDGYTSELKSRVHSPSALRVYYASLTVVHTTIYSSCLLSCFFSSLDSKLNEVQTHPCSHLAFRLFLALKTCSTIFIKSMCLTSLNPNFLVSSKEGVKKLCLDLHKG